MFKQVQRKILLHIVIFEKEILSVTKRVMRITHFLLRGDKKSELTQMHIV